MNDERFKVPSSECPVCGERLDAAGSLETDMKPVEGDLTVCLYCASPLQFGAGLTLERADFSRLDPETVRNVNDALALVRSHTAALIHVLPNAKSCAHPPLEECRSLFCVHCGVVKIDGEVLEALVAGTSRLSVLAALGVPMQGRKPE